MSSPFHYSLFTIENHPRISRKESNISSEEEIIKLYDEEFEKVEKNQSHTFSEEVFVAGGYAKDTTG